MTDQPQPKGSAADLTRALREHDAGSSSKPESVLVAHHLLPGVGAGGTLINDDNTPGWNTDVGLAAANKILAISDTCMSEAGRGLSIDDAVKPRPPTSNKQPKPDTSRTGPGTSCNTWRRITNRRLEMSPHPEMPAPVSLAIRTLVIPGMLWS